MRIIISPAMKMNVENDSLAHQTMPCFIQETGVLLATLNAMSDKELQSLWACNDRLATLNIRRVREMSLEKNLSPAILSYEGIQYRYMAPSVFEASQFAYISTHLRILSGFYGLLKPFDGVVPYRLELGAKLSVAGYEDLYQFWGDKIAKVLCGETDFIVNLTSKEYSRVLLNHLPPQVAVLTCVFGEERDGRVIEKATLCKMARGEMVRFLAENNITQKDDIKKFNRLGFSFSEKYETPQRFVFLKSE